MLAVDLMTTLLRYGGSLHLVGEKLYLNLSGPVPLTFLLVLAQHEAELRGLVRAAKAWDAEETWRAEHQRQVAAQVGAAGGTSQGSADA